MSAFVVTVLGKYSVPYHLLELSFLSWQNHVTHAPLVFSLKESALLRTLRQSTLRYLLQWKSRLN